MNIKDIVNEELNVQFVSKEIAGLETIKKQLDTVIQQNPLIAKAIAQPIGEIEKKLNGLKFAITEYSKKQKDAEKTGVGTQEPVAAVKPPTVKPPTVPTTAAKPAEPTTTTTPTNTKPV